MSRDWLLWLTVVAAAATASFAAPAQAAPPTPEFLAAWKQSDERFAQWDFNGALEAIRPVLGQVGALDGYERVWFDHSAARILSATGDDTAAAQFILDQRTVTGDRVYDDPAGNATSTGYKDWFTTHPKGRFGYGAPEFYAVDAYDKDRTPEAQALEAAASIPVSIYPNHQADILAYDPEADGIVLSYFAPAKTKLGKYAPRDFCCSSERTPVTTNMYFGRLWGSPVGIDGSIGGSLGGKPWVATIPSTQAIVSKRSVAPRSTFTVQHFRVPASRPLIATWFPLERGRKAVRVKYSSAGTSTTVRAPARRGVYRLFIGFASDPWTIATEIDGVGVGRLAAPARQVGASWMGNAEKYPKPRWQP